MNCPKERGLSLWNILSLSLKSITVDVCSDLDFVVVVAAAAVVAVVADVLLVCW